MHLLPTSAISQRLRLCARVAFWELRSLTTTGTLICCSWTQEGQEPTCDMTNSVTTLDRIVRVYADYIVVSYRNLNDIELDQKCALCGRERNKPWSCVVPYSPNSREPLEVLGEWPDQGSLKNFSVRYEPCHGNLVVKNIELDNAAADRLPRSNTTFEHDVTLMRQPRVRWTPRFRRRPRTDTVLVKLLKGYEQKKAGIGRFFAY